MKLKTMSGVLAQSRFLKQALRPLVKLGRRLYRLRWPSNPVKPFVEMFPFAVRHHFKPGETVKLAPDLKMPPFHEIYLEGSGERYITHGHFVIPEDFVAILPGAMFCARTNTVMDSDRFLLKESINPRLVNYPHNFALSMERKPKFVPGYAAPLRANWPAYFHILVDAMPRLLSLHAKPFSDLDEIQLLCLGPPTSLERHLAERLAPGNCSFRILEDRNRLYTVEKLIFTPYKATGGYIRPEYLDGMRQRILPNRRSRRNRRILIARAPGVGGVRVISNMQDLEEALSSLGFETVYPERMDVQSEIETFFDAEIIVGAHGSGLTNMIFADHAGVVELFATREIWPVFYELSQALGHRYRYVKGEGEDLFPVSYDVDIRAVLARVRELVQGPGNRR